MAIRDRGGGEVGGGEGGRMDGQIERGKRVEHRDRETDRQRQRNRLTETQTEAWTKGNRNTIPDNVVNNLNKQVHVKAQRPSCPCVNIRVTTIQLHCLLHCRNLPSGSNT